MSIGSVVIALAGRQPREHYTALIHCDSQEGSTSLLDYDTSRLETTIVGIYHILIFPSVCLCALTLYPATDCAAATDISGVSGRWQLSR